MKYKTASGVIIEADDEVIERVADKAHDAAYDRRDTRHKIRVKLALTTRPSRRSWTHYRTSQGHAIWARARAVSRHLERWARLLEAGRVPEAN